MKTFKALYTLVDVTLGSVRPVVIVDISLRDISIVGTRQCDHLVSARLDYENGTLLNVFARLEHFLMTK